MASAVSVGAELAGVFDDVRAFVAICRDPKGDLHEAAARLDHAVSAVHVDVLVALLLHKAGSAAKPYVPPPPGFVQMATAEGLLFQAPAEAVAAAKAGRSVAPPVPVQMTASQGEGRTSRQPKAGSDAGSNPGSRQQVRPSDRGSGEPSAGPHVASEPVPNAGKAQIDPRKALEYALNPEHPVGGNKARVFESALGFNRSNAAELLRQIQEGVTRIAAQPGKADAFGARYTVDIPVVGPRGSGIVRTGWIVKPGSDVPTLTTMYVK